MIRGQKRPLVKEEEEIVSKVHCKAKASLHNRFDIEKVDAKTGKIKQKAYAENIVLDSLWTRLLTPATYFNYIHFGTGTGTMDVTRTSLFTFLGAKAAGNPVYNIYEDGKYVTCRRECQLSETEYVGSELKEIGIGHGSSVNNLVTHATLKDMNGNSITISKTDTDIIRIYATIHIYWGDVVGGSEVCLHRTSTNVEGDPPSSYITGPGQAGSLFTFLAGASATLPNNLHYSKGSASCVYNTVNGSERSFFNKTISLTCNSSTKKIILPPTRIAAGQANFPIKEIGLTSGTGDGCLAQIIFPVNLNSSFFKKTSIVGEDIGTGDGETTDFKTVFPFVLDGYTVYVNGVPESGVVIDTGLPDVNILDSYMEIMKVGVTTLTRYGVKMIPLPGKKGTSGGNSSYYGGLYCIFRNPFNSLGIDQYSCEKITLQSSDDMVTWGNALPTGSNKDMPPEQKNKKYWRAEHNGASYSQTAYLYNFLCSNIPQTNIHFDTPPDVGDVITADYECEVIAKDENHVFDFSFEISLGEKTN